jgi:TctA family transporter
MIQRSLPDQLQVLRGNARRSISQSDNDEALWMKSPVVLVTAALTVAILLAAAFLIATGTRGEEADRAISQQHAPAVME